jgi:hypothetical protein
VIERLLAALRNVERVEQVYRTQRAAVLDEVGPEGAGSVLHRSFLASEPADVAMAYEAVRRVLDEIIDERVALALEGLG